MAISRNDVGVRDSTGHLAERVKKILTDRAIQAQQLARTTGLLHYACLTVPLDVSLLHWEWDVAVESAISKPRNVWVWSSPTDGRQLAIDLAWSFQTSGAERFGEVSVAISELLQCVVRGHDKVRFVNGYSFFSELEVPVGPWENWPAAFVGLPQVNIFSDDAGWFVSTSMAVGPDTNITTGISTIIEMMVDYLQPKQADATLHPQQGGTTTRQLLTDEKFTADSRMTESWRESITYAANQVACLNLEKVVLSRQMTSQATHPLFEAWRNLSMDYPETYVFLIRHQASCFIGASPETLVKSREGKIFIDCLAGTIRRGVTVEEDERLAEELLNCPKNRAEHAVVVRFTTHEIEDMVCDLTIPESPCIRKLNNVQHLHTPLSATRLVGSVLDFVARLHPTPAVAGVPRQKALQLIQDLEDYQRGWYAAPIGWFDDAGDGEFAVALRSAHLAASGRAHLFAGAGIMGTSTPESEWVETELKLQPMRIALGTEGGRPS